VTEQHVGQTILDGINQTQAQSPWMSLGQITQKGEASDAASDERSPDATTPRHSWRSAQPSLVRSQRSRPAVHETLELHRLRR
jgi:hypothetical protein